MSKVHPLALRLKIRQDFVSGQGSLRQIAQAHGVPVLTAKNWCKQGKWTRARQRFEDRATAEPISRYPPNPQPPQPDHDADTLARLQDLQRLKDQLASLDDCLDQARTPDDWHKLSSARERLFNQWRILADVPLPGSRKPTADKARKAFVPAVPIDE